ncbi:MAG: kynureninase [Povalibacter sp.]
MNDSPTLEDARARDSQDALSSLRSEFHVPKRKDGTESVYLCGHSLGLAPRAAARIVNEELAVWAERGVEGHFDSQRPWLSYHENLTPGLAPLAGAEESEVVAMNSLTVNLHLMLASFYRPTRERNCIVIEKRAFSSDRYAVASHIAQRGFDPQTALIEIEPRAGEELFRTDDICNLIDREGSTIALVMLPGVQYLTGQCFDMRAISAAARRAGCHVGFDLAHAIGNVPLSLHDWDADFAVWCSYKYLNSGPGAIGGAFVHARHARSIELPRFAGWWGHDKHSRFQMPEEFIPLPGAEGWQISNPSVLAAAPLLASIELFQRAGLQQLRAKSVALTAYLEQLLRSRFGHALSVITPLDPEARGCQLSIRLNRPAQQARRVYGWLEANGYICDWREPDVIRVAPVPMYNSFEDVWHFVAALELALRQNT